MSLWLTQGDENQGQIEWKRRVLLACHKGSGAPSFAFFAKGGISRSCEEGSRVKGERGTASEWQNRRFCEGDVSSVTSSLVRSPRPVTPSPVEH